jgi:hypothetical protein
VLVCVSLTVVGVAILAVPSSFEGRVLVPISKGHGLSALDTVGAVLLAVAGTWLEVLIVRRLPYLRLAPRALFGLGLLAGLGIGLVIASVYTAFFWWWAIGSAALGVAAIVLVLLERPIRSRGLVPCIARRRRALVAELPGLFGNAARCGARPRDPGGHSARAP